MYSAPFICSSWWCLSTRVDFSSSSLRMDAAEKKEIDLHPAWGWSKPAIVSFFSLWVVFSRRPFVRKAMRRRIGSYLCRWIAPFWHNIPRILWALACHLCVLYNWKDRGNADLPMSYIQSTLWPCQLKQKSRLVNSSPQRMIIINASSYSSWRCSFTTIMEDELCVYCIKAQNSQMLTFKKRFLFKKEALEVILAFDGFLLEAFRYLGLLRLSRPF